MSIEWKIIRRGQRVWIGRRGKSSGNAPASADQQADIREDVGRGVMLVYPRLGEPYNIFYWSYLLHGRAAVHSFICSVLTYQISSYVSVCMILHVPPLPKLSGA